MRKLVPLRRLLEEAEEQGIDPNKILVDPKEVRTLEQDDDDDIDEDEDDDIDED